MMPEGGHQVNLRERWVKNGENVGNGEKQREGGKKEKGKRNNGKENEKGGAMRNGFFFNQHPHPISPHIFISLVLALTWMLATTYPTTTLAH